MEMNWKFRNGTDAVLCGVANFEPVLRDEMPARSFAGLHCEKLAVVRRARRTSRSGDVPFRSKLANA